MFRVMAWKELREIRGIALLALAVYGLLVASIVAPNAMPTPFAIFLAYRSWGTPVPFVEDSFVGGYWCVSALLAIAVGLRQTLGESNRGTYPFLLHRPSGRRWLIGMKLLVGTSVCLICAAVPILVYGLWAAKPGTHASPFQWSMTVPVWVGWFEMTFLYLASFLGGIRPGRWFRSRLLPLAAALAAVFVAQVAFGGSLWPLLVALVADAWMMAVIFFIVRTRDYS